MTITPVMPEMPECSDIPDTHEWSKDYKDTGRGISRYCVKCGLTSMEHTMRIME